MVIQTSSSDICTPSASRRSVARGEVMLAMRARMQAHAEDQEDSEDQEAPAVAAHERLWHLRHPNTDEF